MQKRPDLAILIGHALKKKGATEHDPMPEKEEGSSEEMDHLKEIAADMIGAIHDKDPDALAELLQEAIECCDQDR